MAGDLQWFAVLKLDGRLLFLNEKRVDNVKGYFLRFTLFGREGAHLLFIIYEVVCVGDFVWYILVLKYIKYFA